MHGELERTRARRISPWYVVALLVLLALGTSATLLVRAARQAPFPLAGDWQDLSNPKHTFAFKPNGKFVASWLDLPYGDFGTWTLDGQTLKVSTIRNWDFEGTLNGDTIDGVLLEMPSRNVLGKCVWKRQ